MSCLVFVYPGQAARTVMAIKWHSATPWKASRYKTFANSQRVNPDACGLSTSLDWRRDSQGAFRLLIPGAV